MNVTGQGVQKHVEQPTHAVPRKYIEPIMYLAERMSQHDRINPPPSKRVVEQLAEALQMKDFRRQPWFRQLSDKSACDQIDLETVKRATLVVLTLVMKVDTTLGEDAKAYFRKLREMMDTEPVAVPSDPEQHRGLALRYLVS